MHLINDHSKWLCLFRVGGIRLDKLLIKKTQADLSGNRPLRLRELRNIQICKALIFPYLDRTLPVIICLCPVYPDNSRSTSAFLLICFPFLPCVEGQTLRALIQFLYPVFQAIKYDPVSFLVLRYPVLSAF